MRPAVVPLTPMRGPIRTAQRGYEPDRGCGYRGYMERHHHGCVRWHGHGDHERHAEPCTYGLSHRKPRLHRPGPEPDRYDRHRDHLRRCGRARTASRAAYQNAGISAATLAAGGTYTFTTTEAGCTSLPATVIVTMNATPVVAAPASATPATVCEGTNSQLNVTVTSAGYFSGGSALPSTSACTGTVHWWTLWR